MNRKTMPLVLMLIAGAVTCIITFVMDYSILGKLVALFATLLIFYFLGCIIKWTLDFFDRQNAPAPEEGEVIEKEPEGDEESGNKEA